MKKSKLLRYLIVSVSLFQSLSYAEDPIRVITIEGSTVPSIGFLSSNEAEAKEASQAIQFDLTMPGYFRTIEVGDASAPALLDSGAFYYVKIKSDVLGDSLKLSYQIHSVENGQVVFPGQKYSVKKKDLRRAAHFISNDIVESLLGEKMAAQSRLVAVSKVNGRKNIVVMDYDGKRPWMLTKDRSINFLPEWGADNQTIYYSSLKPRYPTIFQADLRTGKKVQLFGKKLQAFGPKVSPDGSSLLFVRQQVDGADIYLMDLASKGVRQITFSGAAETSPEWSPNGFHIAYTSDRGGNPKLYKMSREGVGSKRLTFEAKSKYLESAAWSPKGDKIAFVGMDSGRLNVYVMNVDGTGVLQLTQDSGNNENPTWSPDGSMIAFSSTRSGVSQIYLMRADGSNQTRITSGAAHSAPRWSKGLK